MKILGLIGGMSWESTIPYYRMINQHVKEQLGGLHSAKIILYSVDFHEIEQLQAKGDWQTAGQVLSDAAVSLKRAGADVIVVCTNTMHKVADEIETACGLPLLHIADATAAQIKQQGISKIGLLGTRYTMEQDFYRGRLTQKHHIDVITPNSADREIINRIIYEELCLGITSETSRQEYRRIIGHLEEQGAQGVIFGCTEITLLVNAQDARVPVFDTTAIHAKAAAQYALQL
ncbi:TPA: aspartate/glutamate racemase family protein [Yersinia enterocolitica]|uniref:aspartate/glutamate racemase family protein n=1 Tax=Yersinia enterocolitica TaxID=630 RepID=UPI001C666260|nr:aspartate/glutamate racemase family protein [Yersinia enterocolitica]MBW5833961.1 aspartate/glutamate racemase family protein [Yersinia enterocolitica]MBX9473478.1 aspartate/glutamate racemase family protein [Yersinia enterocolitica]HDL8052618.1 aspartate/glutamate racemase family protein [Yersinia enterocolitica]HEI6850619.1 aspartate/glutamate racemase family protein [Yersinia enterocolitica]HEN3568584.1 aspartate/glutamate racemase family protein [Yersinia enterocolitica]